MRIKDMVVGSKGKQYRDQPERQSCGFAFIDKVCDDVGPVLAVVRSCIEDERRHRDCLDLVGVWPLYYCTHASTSARPALLRPTPSKSKARHARYLLFTCCAPRPVAHLT